MSSQNFDISLADPNIIEVVYALPKYQHIFKVELDSFNKSIGQITLLDIIIKSGILDYYTEIDLSQNKVGIFSEIKSLSDFVELYDRVEIYRPLKIEPMEARRLRALKQKSR